VIRGPFNFGEWLPVPNDVTKRRYLGSTTPDTPVAGVGGVATGPAVPSTPSFGTNAGLPDIAAGEVFDLVATGAGVGSTPVVRVFDYHTSGERLRFYAYDQAFTGGVHVATGDVTGDGTEDVITGPGASGGAHIRVFDGNTGNEVMGFFAFDPAFLGGANVAAGDVDGDGRSDIIVGAGVGGGPHVRVFSGATGAEIRNFMAFDASLRSGAVVASGDIDDDGFDDIIVAPGSGGGPNVRVISGATGAEMASFMAFDAAFRGGVYLAAGDVDADGTEDIIVGAAAGGGPNVRVFSGVTSAVIRDFLAYAAGFGGGVRVAAADVNGDGATDIVTGAGTGGSSHVRILSGADGSPLESFWNAEATFLGGVFVG
jgi:hypothetical protein